MNKNSYATSYSNEADFNKVIKKRDNVARKIITEHYNITLHIDRSINYLWFMYNTGTKKGSFRPFIFDFELNLLIALDIISHEEKSNITNMFNSEDNDNVYIAVLSIDNFRKQRIKIHGEWKNIDSVSDKFKKVVDKYQEIIVNKSFYLD
jgi:hypothetical protein